MTSRTSASSTVPEKPLAVLRSPIFDLIMRTTSAVGASFSFIAFVSVSLSCCSSGMELVYPQPGVEDVTKTVAQQVQSEAREGQRQAGEEAHPERLADDVLAAGDDVAPRRHVRRYPDAQEAQNRLGQDRVGEDEARLHQEGADAVRQDVAERDDQVAPAESPGGLDVVELAKAQHGAADQHGGAGRVHDGQREDDVADTRATRRHERD